MFTVSWKKTGFDTEGKCLTSCNYKARIPDLLPSIWVVHESVCSIDSVSNSDEYLSRLEGSCVFHTFNVFAEEKEVEFEMSLS